MKNTYLKTWILPFLNLIFLLNCKDKVDPPTIYIDQETKDFCVFNKGTWWVYQNLRTFTTDTWKVESVFTGILKPSKSRFLPTEIIKLNITTKNNDTFIFDISQGKSVFGTYKNFGLLQLCYIENGKNSSTACDNNILNVLKRDSIALVCVFKEFKMDQPCTNYFPYHVKWKRNIGISELVYPNGDTLRLKTQNILQ